MLRWPAALAVLLDALADIDRLVLLGDLAELMTRHPRRPLAAAEPVLRAIGARMGPDREVVLVPGNHDAPLIRAWARAQGRGLTVDGSVPVDATRALALVVSWLAPARVRVHYPGRVALGRRVRHPRPLPGSPPAAGVGVRRAALGGRCAPVRSGRARADYERTRRRVRSSQRSFLERLIERPFPTLLEGGAHMLRATAVPAVPRLLLNVRLAPVTAAAGRSADAARLDPGDAAGGDAARSAGRLGGVRPRAPGRAAGRRLAGALVEVTTTAGRGTSTPARGCTSRCWSTGPRRRIRTGRAARSCSSPAGTLRWWGCSTDWARTDYESRGAERLTGHMRPVRRCRLRAYGRIRWLSPNSCHR